jgi:hypothetical protein
MSTTQAGPYQVETWQFEGCRSKGPLQELLQYLKVDPTVKLRRIGGANAVLIIEALDHRQLEEVGPHAVARLEDLEHARLVDMQQVGEAGTVGRHNMGGGAEQGDLLAECQLLSLNRHETVTIQQFHHLVFIAHLPRGYTISGKVYPPRQRSSGSHPLPELAGQLPDRPRRSGIKGSTSLALPSMGHVGDKSFHGQATPADWSVADAAILAKAQKLQRITLPAIELGRHDHPGWLAIAATVVIDSDQAG